MNDPAWLLILGNGDCPKVRDYGDIIWIEREKERKSERARKEKVQKDVIYQVVLGFFYHPVAIQDIRTEAETDSERQGWTETERDAKRVIIYESSCQRPTVKTDPDSKKYLL